VQAKEAEAALARLSEERNAVLSDKDAAVRQAVDLQSEVGAWVEGAWERGWLGRWVLGEGLVEPA